MSSRWILALLAVPAAFVLAGGCALVTASDLANGSTNGAGASPFDAHAGTGTTTGAGGGLAIDAGDASVNSPVTSYQYLCGGSNAACLPGKSTDQCAPGGDPGIGGSSQNMSTYSCQLVAPDAGPVVAQCGTAGMAADGDPCSTALDCGAELGCIATGVTPICRTYCCDSLESCPANTYCVKAPMSDAPSNEIPVCIPAQKCVLLDDSTCPAGLTCTIVRESGTTSCVTPGPGTSGEACPCAAGYTCSWTDGTCVQLCHIGSNECPPNAYCQGGLKPYPDMIGYCVPY